MKKNTDSLNQSKNNIKSSSLYEEYWNNSVGSNNAKLDNFTKYTSRETITRFLVRNEIFKMQLNTHGSILDFGVRRGASLMTWSHLSSIYEPSNYTREIVGFDTFTGFPSVNTNDSHADYSNKEIIYEGSFSSEENMKQDIETSINIWDQSRYLNHIEKTKLIEGDILETLPKFIDDNPHLVVSLLHIDVDLYEPTKLILELVIPKMPKGSVILFDELHLRSFPGETVAVDEILGIHNLELKRFNYSPNISYTIL